MKILITLLLALFISGQAMAVDSSEVIYNGEIISKNINARQTTFVIKYKKEIYKCHVDNEFVKCFKPYSLNTLTNK